MLRHLLLRNWVSRAVVLIAVISTTGGLSPSEVKAQDWIYFSDRSDDPDPDLTLPLRPGILQKFFIYVKNPDAAKKTVTLQVYANDKPIPGASQTLAVEPRATAQVFLGKPPEPGMKPAPLALNDIPGASSVTLKLLEKEANKPDKVLDDATLDVKRPAEYVNVESRWFYPAMGNSLNKLEITLKARPEFAGPRAKAELVLMKDRIPGLSEQQKGYGTRTGFLARPGSQTTLTALGINFEAGAQEQNGLVYVTVDDYPRSFIFETSFPRTGARSEPVAFVEPVARMTAPEILTPGQPCKVDLEIDNAPGVKLELGLDRDNDGQFKAENDELILFEGPRRIKLKYSAASPDGALVLQAEVADWSHEFDLAGINGERNLRLRLLQGDTPISFFNSLTRERKDFYIHTLALDGSPPDSLEFVDNFPEQLLRGSPLDLQVKAVDLETGIRNVVFFVGKPGPDGKAPPTAQPVQAELTDGNAKEDQEGLLLYTEGTWEYQNFFAPTDQKGEFEITAQATNKAGQTVTKTIKIQLVDPPPPGAPNGGKNGPPPVPAEPPSIEGTVLEGGRGQPGLIVNLANDMGAIKDTTTTDDKGKFLFKNVEPGVYSVTSSKVGSNTRGATTVGVKEGKKVIEVELFRQ